MSDRLLLETLYAEKVRAEYERKQIEEERNSPTPAPTTPAEFENNGRAAGVLKGRDNALADRIKVLDRLIDLWWQGQV